MGVEFSLRLVGGFLFVGSRDVGRVYSSAADCGRSELRLLLAPSTEGVGCFRFPPAAGGFVVPCFGRGSSSMVEEFCGRIRISREFFVEVTLDNTNPLWFESVYFFLSAAELSRSIAFTPQVF